MTALIQQHICCPTPKRTPMMVPLIHTTYHLQMKQLEWPRKQQSPRRQRVNVASSMRIVMTVQQMKLKQHVKYLLRHHICQNVLSLPQAVVTVKVMKMRLIQSPILERANLVNPEEKPVQG